MLPDRLHVWALREGQGLGGCGRTESPVPARQVAPEPFELAPAELAPIGDRFDTGQSCSVDAEDLVLDAPGELRVAEVPDRQQDARTLKAIEGVRAVQETYGLGV